MSALPQPVETTGYHETRSMILPAAVPPELDAMVEAAARRAEAMAAHGRELHFAVDAAGGLAIELRDANGVAKTLTPTQAVGLMGGLGQV